MFITIPYKFAFWVMKKSVLSNMKTHWVTDKYNVEQKEEAGLLHDVSSTC